MLGFAVEFPVRRAWEIIGGALTPSFSAGLAIFRSERDHFLAAEQKKVNSHSHDESLSPQSLSNSSYQNVMIHLVEPDLNYHDF
jgi:hypothetical protein